MKTVSTATTAQYADIARIIHGKPAASVSRLPAVWHAFRNPAYVEAAQLFCYHGTPLAMESLSAIGEDFELSAYPDLDKARQSAKTDVARKAVRAVQDLFVEFGHDVPASFYEVILATALRDTPQSLMDMFKDKKQLMKDRLQDAVLHAMLLVTPVGLRVQSILSRHGLRFTHVMNCGCSISESVDAPFFISLDESLKPAYLQNLVAASFEQYGVNASTSRAGRGF